ncbi:hypothetical protein FQZ97_880270 [compost metagenome]
MYLATLPALCLISPDLLMALNRFIPTACAFFSMATKTVSTMTSVPSSSRPKSMAPSEIRLAGKPWILSMVKAKRKESGITVATITVVRQLKRKMKTTTETKTIPSTRFLVTVCTVAFTSSVRSIKASIFTSPGKISLFSSAIFSFNRGITSPGFSPRNIITTPCTRSSSSCKPTWPRRGLAATSTRATCLTSTGLFPFTSIRIFSISSILSSKPTPRTT